MSIDILGWEKVNLSDKKYFKIIGSGVNYFKGTKNYYSTSSVDGNKVLNPEGEFTYFNRPSRANMQPSNNTVWFAKMKNTLKVIKCSERFNANSILSTGFSGIYSDKVLAEYLEQIFLSEDFNVQKDNLSEGSTQQAINNSKLKDIYVDIPLNLNEQKKIAEILTKVDEAIENTEQLIQKYEQVKVGLMQDLLTKGIDENGNIRSEETHQFKDSPLGRIPVEWEVKPLGELIEAIDPQPDHRTPAEVLNGVPYIGISDVNTEGKIDFINSRKVGLNVLNKQNKSFKIEQNDIIFGKIGTIGRPTLLPHIKNLNYTLSANIILIQPKISKLFIYYILLSEYIENQIQLSIHSTSQPAFGMNKIRSLEIKLPKISSNEFDSIVKPLIKIDNKLNKEREILRKIKIQKQGLMQDLLSGKVRVNF